MDLAGLVTTLASRGEFLRVVNNPLSQQGTPQRRYLGATILPERPVPENEFTEEGIRFKTIIANDSTRYSPVQLKQGGWAGRMRVTLGEIDTGSEITAKDYDALIRLLEQRGTRPTMQAAQTVLRWVDRTLNLPLIEKMEKQRWDAVVDASVVRTGDNNYTETVSYPNPTGHRVAAGGNWSNNAYDPWPDIIAGAEFLTNKGFTVNRIIAPSPAISKLSGNAKIKERLGRISIIGSTIVGLPSRVNLNDLNGELANDALPPIEKYDLKYNTQTSSGFFLKRDVFVMLATTGRDEEVLTGTDSDPVIVPNTLGYQAVGRAAGQSGAGRVVRVESFDRKPPRIEGESWSTTLPVILDPEGIYVITGIA